jgi:DNA polymerase zeta
MVKQAMKLPNTPEDVKRILDDRQLALKLIANVTYGYTSASFSGRMPYVDLADSTVQIDRKALESAINMIDSNQVCNFNPIFLPQTPRTFS